MAMDAEVRTITWVAAGGKWEADNARMRCEAQF